MSALLVSVAVALCATSDPGQAVSRSADIAAIYDGAIRDRREGRPAEAIVGLTAVLAQSPGNLDARLNLGLALLAEGRLDDAETAFEFVLEQAPAYGDARLGLARVAQRRGDLTSARQILDTAEATGGVAASEIAGLRTSLERETPRRWRLSMATSVSDLSDDLPEWRSSSVIVSHADESGRALSVAIEATERFAQDDLYLEGRVDQRVGARSFYLAVGGSREAVYRPEVAAWAGGQFPIGPVMGTVDLGLARYRAGTVVTVRPGLTVPIRQHASLTLQWIGVRDETGEQRGGYSLRGAFTAAQGIRLHAGYADAPESSDGMTMDVASTSLGLAVDLSSRITVFIDGVHEERSAYQRDEASLALGWRF